MQDKKPLAHILPLPTPPRQQTSLIITVAFLPKPGGGFRIVLQEAPALTRKPICHKLYSFKGLSFASFWFLPLKEHVFYPFHGSSCLSDDIPDVEHHLHSWDPSLQKMQTVRSSLKEWFSRDHLGSKPEENVYLTQNSVNIRNVYAVREG